MATDCEDISVNFSTAEEFSQSSIIGVVAGGQHMSRPPPDFVPEAGICVEN